MHLTLTQYVVVAAIVALGAVAQGSVGFGLNLVAAPIVGLVAPQLLPATMVVVGLPLSASIAVRGRRHIDWQGVGWTTLGRLPGTVAGAVVVAVVSLRALGGIVGGAGLAACALTALGDREHQIDRRASLAAGAASGFMDTAAATGGPPLALLYQHRPAGEVRSTLATCFVGGTFLAVAGLVLGGKVEPWHLFTAATLAPALAVGLAVSRLVARRIDGRSIRPAVLSFAALAGAAALIRAIAG